MSQKSYEARKYPAAEFVNTASSEEVSQPSTKCRVDPCVRDTRDSSRKEEDFKDELMHVFERERAELEMYFENKMDELLRAEISNRGMEFEEAVMEKTLALENMFAKRMAQSLQDGKKRLKERLLGFNLDEKFGREGSELKENLDVMKQDAVRAERINMQGKEKEDESQLENNFTLRLEDAEVSLQMLKDEFKSNVAKRRAIMGKQSRCIVTDSGEKLEAEYQNVFRKDMSHEKKEAAREKSEAETKFKKEKRQLESFFLRLTETEAVVQDLKNESEKRIEMEKERRRKIVELEEKLKGDYEVMLSRQISHEKEEARRNKIEIDERFRKEKLQLEENFNLKLCESESALKKLRAELQQRERIEREHRDTIMKLEAKLQEERQIRLIVGRELQTKKAEFATEESLNRNENRRLRNEIDRLRREIEQRDKETKREVVEELQQGSATLTAQKNESLGVEVDSPQKIKEEIVESEIQKEKVRNRSNESLNVNENEHCKDEIEALRAEVEEKNKKIERLLGIKQENELKILNLAKRLERRARRSSKQADARRRQIDSQIESPELSNKTTSEDGEKIFERNSWDLEGSLRDWEDTTLKSCRGVRERNTVVPFVKETSRKMLVVVTFEKRIEQGILRLFSSLFPREIITPTIRVVMKQKADDQLANEELLGLPNVSSENRTGL